MEKKRLFQILSRAQRNDVIRLGERIQQQYPVTIVKKPEKSLTMIRMREPVKNSLFYLGEAIITEAVVSLGDTVGTAVTMGDDFEKTLHMAIIDAASLNVYARQGMGERGIILGSYNSESRCYNVIAEIYDEYAHGQDVYSMPKD